MGMGRVHEEESHPAILLNFEWAFFGDCSTLWEQGSTKPNLKTISEGVSPPKPEDEPCDAGHYVIGVSVARNLFLCLNVKNVVSSNSPS